MRKADMVRANAQQLFVAEDAIETALSEVGKLAYMLSDSRVKTRLSAVVGQKAIDRLATLYHRLSVARGEVVELHHSLDEIKTQIGAGAVAMGGDNGKPPPPPGGQLRVVAETVVGSARIEEKDVA